LKIPKRLKPLVEDGLIDEVIRPLMSGKEADVFIVRCGSELHPEAELSGEYSTVEVDADVDAVLEEIKQTMREEEQRLARLAEAS
jgi:serine/threonine-protein kinase RIO1